MSRVQPIATRVLHGAAALAASLSLLACLAKRDPDIAKPEDAIELAAGTPKMNQLDCDDGEGDCNDWYRIAVAEAGTLEVTLATVAGQGAGAPLGLTLADADQLTLAETASGGRPRFGLRWAVEPGTYFVWVRADGSTRGELGYQISRVVKEGEVSGDLGVDVDASAPRLCLEVEASERANFYAGQPHVVRLTIHPLTSALGFEQAHVDDLVAGVAPAGVSGEPIVVRVVPGEKRRLTDTLPANTRTLGIVADFYRPPGIRGGRRKASISASCARETRIFLDESELKLP